MKYKLLLSGILSGLLVFAMMLFAGCGDGGDDNNNGNNDNTDTRGFLEILYGESSGNSSTDNDEGVYVGIISFAEDATVITNPVLLDDSGYNTLKSKISNDYRRASEGGTTMFLAVHKALAELKKNESTYPAKLDTVSIITFTDGLDNQSLAMLANSTNQNGPNYHLEGKTYDTSDPKSAGNYMDYIKGEIDGRDIMGHTIKAYAVGVKGTDVVDEASFDARLLKIASNGKDESGVPYVTKLTDFSKLRETFQSIAKGLNVTHTNVTIVMTTTQNATGTVYRWAFDKVNGTVGNSKKYIEATFTDSGSDYILTNITYAGGISTAQGNGPLTGVVKTVDGKRRVDFTFTDVSGYDPDTEGDPSQWIKTYGSTVFGPESEVDSTGKPTKTQEHKTAYIYLVLDASTSLSDANISSIKSVISSGSSSGGNNNGNNQAPNAPTNVTASAQSSSSIEVTWQSVANASYYRVYRATSASGSYESMGETYDTKYTDTNVSAGTTYYYKVIAVNGTGQSSYSSYASASPSSSSSGAPSAPTGVSASAYSNYIEVTWQSVANVSYYMIYRATSPYDSYESVGDTYDTKYTDTNVGSGTTYYYKIIAVNDAGESNFSSYASATPSSSGYSAALSAPTGVTASAYSNAIEITWQSVANASFYRVYRYRGTGAYDSYENYYETSYTYYTDTNLSTGTTYYYQVVAVNSEGYEGNYSSYASATTSSSSSGNSAPSAPTGVTASAYSDSIEVTWQSVANAYYYMIYRATSASGSYESVADTYYAYYTDTNVSAGTTYYYKVVAVNSAGYESSMSSYASATISSSSISLSYGTWYDNTLSAGDTHYYSFYAYAGTTYLVLWRDYDYDTYYGDIKVSATTSGGSPLFTNVDEGYYYGESFSVSSSGYITLTVTGNSASSSGAYRIAYTY
jgi:fibronectin type 3 domain-containing protein